MSDDDAFNENPFRALKGELFPDAAKKNAADCRVRRAAGAAAHAQHALRQGKAKVAAHADSVEATGCDAAEADLFLQAVSRVTPGSVRKAGKGQVPKPGQHNGLEQGFTLEEHGLLHESERTGRAEQGRDRKEAAAARPVPSRQPQGAHHGIVSGRGAVQSGGRAAHAAQTHALRLAGTAAQQATGADLPADTDDDAAVFLQALGRDTLPLQARGREVPLPPPPSMPPPGGELSLQDFMEGKLEFALSFTDEYLEGHVVGLDQLTMNKLRAGSLSPEAHLDLHGLNAEQAFEALRGFLRGSWYKGLRTVLVVPGRGRNSPDGQGILREKLQSWLTQDPFKRVVLAFCTAQPHDGGPGSVYVLLRKYRKKGRVCWERMPADADLY